MVGIELKHITEDYVDITRAAIITNTSKELLSSLIALGELCVTEDTQGEKIHVKELEKITSLQKAIKENAEFNYRGKMYLTSTSNVDLKYPKWLVNKVVLEVGTTNVLGKELIPKEEFEQKLVEFHERLGVSYQEVRKEFKVNLLTMKWISIVTGIYPHVDGDINKRNLIFSREEYDKLKEWYCKFKSQTNEKSIKNYIEDNITEEEFSINYRESVKREGFYTKKVSVYLLSKQCHEDGIVKEPVEGVRSFWLEDAISRQKFKQTLLDASVIVDEEIGIEITEDMTKQDLRNIKNVVKLLNRVTLSEDVYVFRNMLTGEKMSLENLRSAFE